MEANAKAGDSTAPSHLDISGAASMMCETVQTNKENMGPQPPRISFALLDNEVSASPEDRTILHALPHENNSSENAEYAELFQLKSFLGTKKPLDASATLKESAMEVSMMWQDIMSQTKEPTATNKIPIMGNTMDLTAASRDMDISGRSTTVLRTRETIYEGHMDISKSVIVPRNPQDTVYNNVISIKSSSQRQTVYYDPVNGNMDQSVAVPSSRETIHFNPEDCHLDESIMLNELQSRQPPVRQTIHYADENDCMEMSGRKTTHQQTVHYNGEIDENMSLVVVPQMVGVDKENYPVQRKGRETVHYAAGDGDMDMSRGGGMLLPPPSKNRATIYYAPESATMEESIVLPPTTVAAYHIPTVDKDNYLGGALPKHRPTIHFQTHNAEMDETIHAPSAAAAAPKPSRQTIVFREEEGQLEESLQIASRAPPPPDSSPAVAQKPSRQTIHFNAVEGDDLMDESVRQQPTHTLHERNHSQRTATISRQTINLPQSEANMDESVQIAPALPTNVCPANLPRPTATIRQSVYYNENEGQMDESIAAAQPKKARKSVYFGAEGAEMDVSAVSAPRVTRQTIHFDRQEAQMDESIAVEVVTKKSRPTIHFNHPSAEAAMEESVREERGYVAHEPNGDLEVPPLQPPSQWSHAPRQTIVFDRNAEGGMDESVAPQRVTRQSVYFGPEGGQMEESVIVQPRHGYNEKDNDEDMMEVEEGAQRTPGKRGTILFRPEEGAMDETGGVGGIIDAPRPKTRAATEQRLRQTTYDRREMEVSMNVLAGDAMMRMREEGVAAQIALPTQSNRPRHSVYYRDQDNCDLDISCAPAVPAVPVPSNANVSRSNPRRETVHFSQDDGGMEESLVISKTGNKCIAEYNASRAAEQTAMHESSGAIADVEPERRMGPLEMSLRTRSNRSGVVGSGNRTVREALEIAIHERSRREMTANKSGEELLLAMEESMQVGHKSRPQNDLKRRSRETIFQAAAMEESLVVHPPPAPDVQLTRRGTFNVPLEESKMQSVPTQRSSSALLKNNATAMDWDSLVSDLNNSEDSVELLDSQDRATRPMSRASQRMSLASPLLPQDETVNELILNFNVTGQFVGPKELAGEEEEQEQEQEPDQVKQLAASTTRSIISRIPVAKVASTPRRIAEAERLDLSTVDSVCRDAVAPAMMSRFTFGVGADPKDEITFVDGRKGQLMDVEHRLSIPAFVEEELERMDQTKRQTMLEIKELLSDGDGEADEEEVSPRVTQVNTAAAKYRQLDFELLGNIDFEEARELLKTMRFQVEKVMHTSPVEQSLYLCKTMTEERGLKDEIRREIEE